jgi:hypothetical protein
MSVYANNDGAAYIELGMHEVAPLKTPRALLGVISYPVRLEG